eukprot:GFUD01036864.1.p1 GENE.GFUD01036864.1~~GFUD01036864.1.p1  ORF type:complete len:1534 (+),score=418.92 GFUD01036864.1:96-4697(+)
MERTPSKERVIPIEIIGTISDVLEEDIDVDQFVESLNSNINISKPPKRGQSTPDKPKSNRSSLIITHEDGTTEENDCVVTCLGVSSESIGSQGLTIEEISQDTLKGRLENNKLQVLIPDVSQVVISEIDEVTDASFVSTPEEEDVIPLVTETCSDASVDDSALFSTQTLTSTIAQEGQGIIIMQQLLLETEAKHHIEVEPEEISSVPCFFIEHASESDEVELLHTRDSKNLIDIKDGCKRPEEIFSDDDNDDNALKEGENTNQHTNIEINEKYEAIEIATPENQSSEFADKISKKMIEPEISEMLSIKIEPEEKTQHSISIQQASHSDDLEYLESNEELAIATEDLQSIEMEGEQIPEIQIKIEEANIEETEKTISKQSRKESPNCVPTRKEWDPLNEEDIMTESKFQEVEQIGASHGDEVHNKLSKINSETVRIIPISLPGGRLLEKRCLSNDCIQVESNESQQMQNEETVNVHESREKISGTQNEGNMQPDLARVITIQLESGEMLSNFQTEKDNDAKYGEAVENKEESQTKNSSDESVCRFSQSSTKVSSQSIERSSEISNITSCKEQTKKFIESDICMDGPSNTRFTEFERKISSCDLTKDSAKTTDDTAQKEERSRNKSQSRNIQEAEDVDDKQSEMLIENKLTIKTPLESFATDSDKVRAVPIKSPDSSDTSGKLSNKVISIGETVKVDHESSNKSKQTEETQSVNTCLVTSPKLAGQSKEVEKDIFNNCKQQISNLACDPISNEGNAGQVIRNIPIQIQRNVEETEISSESESMKNKQKLKEMNKNEECEYEGTSMRKNGSNSSLLTKETFEEVNEQKLKSQNMTSNISSSERVTLPLVRTVPIQILGHPEEKSVDLREMKDIKDNPETKAASKSISSPQMGRNIPIKRFSATHDKESKVCSEENTTSEKIETGFKTDPTHTQNLIPRDNKKDNPNKDNQMNLNVQQQAAPKQPPQGLINVPIQRQASTELQNKPLNSPQNKSLNTENNDKNPKGQMSRVVQETPSTFIDIKDDKDSCSNLPKSQTNPSVSTSKPPQAMRSIPILRQSVSDSGAGMQRQQTSARQRTLSGHSSKGDILQRVHAELEEARVKLTAQANSLSSGLENIYKPDNGKIDARSKSLESEQRYQGARPKNTNQRHIFKRERSLQDIDKDIETIWKELQELDQPQEDKNTQRRSRNHERPPSAPVPLSEQTLVTPSWRSPTPPPQMGSFRNSTSNPNISNTNASRQPILPTPTPSTIWDIPSTNGPKYEPTPVGQLSSSSDSKPQYFPTKSATHFSFVPKAETKPGAITPAYVKSSPKLVRPSFRSVPIEKSEASVPLETDFPLQTENNARSTSVPRIINNQSNINSSVFTSEETRKSCLKSEKASLVSHPTKNRSQSPSSIRFSTKMITKPKTAVKGQKTFENSSETDPPFEWVDFRKKDGEIVKGTILPPLHRENDVIIAREVPIINVLLDDAMKEDIKVEPNIKKTSIKENEIKIQKQTHVENKVTKDDECSETPKDAFNACDAGTQTEKVDKKGGCQVM